MAVTVKVLATAFKLRPEIFAALFIIIIITLISSVKLFNNTILHGCRNWHTWQVCHEDQCAKPLTARDKLLHINSRGQNFFFPTQTYALDEEFRKKKILILTFFCFLYYCSANFNVSVLVTYKREENVHCMKVTDKGLNINTLGDQ
jgi:hypothetical protein